MPEPYPDYVTEHWEIIESDYFYVYLDIYNDSSAFSLVD